MKRFFKILLMSFLIFISVFALVIVIFNCTKFLVYKDYFNISTDLTVNEGLGDGYVPQGVTKVMVNDQDVYITSGYMSNKKPSRLYVIKPKITYYVEVLLNDYDLSYGHFGGITSTKEHVFLSCDGNVYTLELKDILKAEYVKLTSPEQNDVRITNTFQTGVAASYVYADLNDQNIYVGEFAGHKYQPNHDTLVNGGKDTYHSYVEKYNVDDVISKNTAKPLLKYAVRDLVQGFAITDDKILLSTSWGVSSSNFYSYSLPTEFDDEENKIYYLDDRYLQRTISAPPMSEALDYDGKQFITLYESASNKYIFGKFFFANKIVGLEI